MIMLVSILIVNMIAEVVNSLPTLQDLSTENRVNSDEDYVLIPRKDWQARAPIDKALLDIPVPFVVIHHSFIPPICMDRTECAYSMRTMQSMHMDDKKWSDIAYNFAVGGDGKVYEGRGWSIIGAHSLYFNKDSIGICLIGNYNDSLPPEKMLKATKLLIEDGVRLGYLKPEYKLVGHRQVRPTECPGNSLFEEIQSWPNYTSKDYKENYYRHRRMEEQDIQTNSELLKSK